MGVCKDIDLVICLIRNNGAILYDAAHRADMERICTAGRAVFIYIGMNALQCLYALRTGVAGLIRARTADKRTGYLARKRFLAQAVLPLYQDCMRQPGRRKRAEMRRFKFSLPLKYVKFIFKTF